MCAVISLEVVKKNLSKNKMLVDVDMLFDNDTVVRCWSYLESELHEMFKMSS